MSGPALIESRLDRLAAAVAVNGMVVAGRSSDTGSGLVSGMEWAGWDTAVAVVVHGQAVGIALATVDRLGRDAHAAMQRATTLTEAGGQTLDSGRRPPATVESLPGVRGTNRGDRDRSTRKHRIVVS